LSLDSQGTALTVIDVQEAFRPVIPHFDQIARNVAILVQAARALDVPIAPTEQYPKGLGRTVPEVAEHLPDWMKPTEKMSFSAARADGFDIYGRTQVLVCGIEAHVCVAQTVNDLLERDVEVHVARDAVASRTEENREVGLRKMERAGAVITSVETALFELLGSAESPAFKQVQALVK
jgi:nicotinamidase-related amidase